MNLDPGLFLTMGASKLYFVREEGNLFCNGRAMGL